MEKNNLRLIVMDNIMDFGKKVDEHLKKMRGIEDENFSRNYPLLAQKAVELQL